MAAWLGSQAGQNEDSLLTATSSECLTQLLSPGLEVAAAVADPGGLPLFRVVVPAAIALVLLAGAAVVVALAAGVLVGDGDGVAAGAGDGAGIWDGVGVGIGVGDGGGVTPVPGMH